MPTLSDDCAFSEGKGPRGSQCRTLEGCLCCAHLVEAWTDRGVNCPWEAAGARTRGGCPRLCAPGVMLFPWKQRPEPEQRLQRFSWQQLPGCPGRGAHAPRPPDRGPCSGQPCPLPGLPFLPVLLAVGRARSGVAPIQRRTGPSPVELTRNLPARLCRPQMAVAGIVCLALSRAGARKSFSMVAMPPRILRKSLTGRLARRLPRSIDPHAIFL